MDLAAPFVGRLKDQTVLATTRGLEIRSLAPRATSLTSAGAAITIRDTNGRTDDGLARGGGNYDGRAFWCASAAWCHFPVE